MKMLLHKSKGWEIIWIREIKRKDDRSILNIDHGSMYSILCKKIRNNNFVDSLGASIGI